MKISHSTKKINVNVQNKNQVLYNILKTSIDNVKVS